MLRKSRSFGLAIAILIVLGLAIDITGPAKASTFTINSSNGGDGFFTLLPGGFDLFGADNDVGPSLTTYLTTATAVATLTFKWSYQTADEEPLWDPAGYVLNGSLTQLTVDDGFLSQDGIVTFAVLAGDTYGFYVGSVDSIFGRAHIEVTATPLPAALVLFASGLGILRLFSRRRKCDPMAPLVAT